jgi:hypothetical protein
MVAAIADLQALIKGRYLDATFDLFEGDDPQGIYLNAVIDVEDALEVLDFIVNKIGRNPN